MIPATFFGVGFLPLCPGTFASLAAVCLYGLLLRFALPVQCLVVISLFFLGVWSASQAEVFLESRDPRYVVIDEVVGYLITMGFLPFSLVSAFIGFFLFRMFDILKPFPIKKFEEMPGGWGIMMDDVMAGIYGLCVLRILIILLPNIS